MNVSAVLRVAATTWIVAFPLSLLLIWLLGSAFVDGLTAVLSFINTLGNA